MWWSLNHALVDSGQKKGKLIVAYVEYCRECVAGLFREREKDREREKRKTSGNRIKSRAIDRNIQLGFTRGHK